MKFAIVGAGAIGAFMGAMLAKAGEDVTLIARGPHMRAMKENGVRVRGKIGDFTSWPTVTDDPATIGAIDCVVIALKAHSLIEMAPRLRPLLGPETAVVAAQNGIPWWYFYKLGGEWDGLHLESVDPGKVISENLPPWRAIGCVIYCSTIIPEPGVVEHIDGVRFSLGEPDGSKSARCQAISQAFIHAGLKSPIRSNIRQEIWVKLLGNVVFNPISALSRATLQEITEFSETRALAECVMAESGEVASRLGVELEITIEQRIAGAQRVGHHKTSMLQDVEAGRALELDPIVGAVVELGDKLGIPMPYTRTLYACTKLLERTLTSHSTRA